MKFILFFENIKDGVKFIQNLDTDSGQGLQVPPDSILWDIAVE